MLLEWLLPELTSNEWAFHLCTMFISILLLIFAEPIFSIFERTRNQTIGLRIFKALNLLVIFLHLVDLVVLRLHSQYERYLVNLALSLLILYIGLFTYSLAHSFTCMRFGKENTIDGEKVYIETYRTRIVSLLTLIVILLSTIYGLIVLWGADNLLSTTGIFGIFAGFMALTSHTWGPDVISGLIILKSEILQDGDVVVIDGYPDEYIINRVSFIYVTLLDVRNNHRTLIKNSRFIQSKINNLSRVASTDGLRQPLVYNIGYPDIKGATSKERLEMHQKFINRIDNMFDKAQAICVQNDDIKINTSQLFEWAVTETSNYSLEVTLWVYLQRMPNTKVTRTIRQYYMGTIYKINETVYRESIATDIPLATPSLNHVVVHPVAIGPEVKDQCPESN